MRPYIPLVALAALLQTGLPAATGAAGPDGSRAVATLASRAAGRAPLPRDAASPIPPVVPVTATATVSVTITAAPTGTQTVTPTVAPTPPPHPGGRWIAPAARFVARGDVLRLSARADPARVGDPPVARVVFTARWPGSRPATGPTVCTVTRPATGTTDLYSCDWNVRASGVPNGPLTLGFSVVDAAGHVTTLANGVRHGTVAQPIRKVVVLVQGVCTSLGEGTATSNSTFGALQTTLQRKSYGYHDGDFLLFSYRGGIVGADGRWRHHAYGPFDPVRTNFETAGWSLLQNGLLAPYHARHPNTTFVLVGHSLGGMVVLQELANTVAARGYRNGFISAIVTVDSPLHGVPAVELLLGTLLRRYPRIGTSLDCVTRGQAATMLANIHANSRTGRNLTNVAVLAHAHGVGLTTVGNRDDCVWAPDRCGGPPIGDAGTQWLSAPGVRKSVATIPKPCLGLAERCFIGTHGAALSGRDGPATLALIANAIGRQR